ETDLFLREWSRLHAPHRENGDSDVMLHERYTEECAVLPALLRLFEGVLRVLQHAGDVQRLAEQCGARNRLPPIPDRQWMLARELDVLAVGADRAAQAIDVSVEPEAEALLGVAQARRRAKDRIEDGVEIRRCGAHRPQHGSDRALLLARACELGLELRAAAHGVGHRPSPRCRIVFAGPTAAEVIGFTQGHTSRPVIPLETLRAAPKVLLHDHLDGGLRPATVVELARDLRYTGLPTTDARELARWFHASAASGSLALYLRGFAHTIAVMQSPESIERVAYECGEDLARDGVVYAESRYAPIFSTAREMSLQDVVDAV